MNFCIFLSIFYQNKTYTICYSLLLAYVLTVSQVSMKSDKKISSNTSSDRTFNRIMDGLKVPLGLAPYQVSIQERSEIGTNWCGGAIISEMWVITAAHCINETTNIIESYLLAVGFVNLKAENISYHKIQNSIPHEKYNSSTHENDIGLLRVKGKFKFNKHINKIPYAQLPPKVGTICLISGWGSTGTKGRVNPEDLFLTGIQVLDDAVCKTRIPDFESDRQICSGGKESRDFCSCDSGSPYICLNGGLSGIVSYGQKNCGEDDISVFTNVYYYRLWIRHIMDDEASFRGRENCSTDLKALGFLVLLTNVCSIFLIEPLHRANHYIFNKN